MLHLPNEYVEPHRKPLQFDGFQSLFLYRRFYRCYVSLHGFYVDNGNVERKKDLSLEDFDRVYDGQKPVLLSGLAETWPARHKWGIDQLLLNYGDTAFRISQRSSRKITMKFRDYVSYMQTQHDEDPLYIFDEKFGEVTPGLLEEYSVPHLFQEDLFDVLDHRPPFRWLIIGPERSGASWHVDPALTSAWNTLLCGRKRWALYPPGRVPLGVTVHVNDEDGDVNVETPSSLQWWLDFYPLLADEDKPIECTQLPGETIFVPSGWWHCVLNLETTVAVTQNFVNSKNFEFVCLDMAPGFLHKGVCRAGLLAFDEGSFEDAEKNTLYADDNLTSHSDHTRKEKRVRVCKSVEDTNYETDTNSASKSYELPNQKFSYDINYLAKFLDEERDHYSSLWSSGNCIGQRELREWLWKLWVGKPGLRDLIWKGASLALNCGKWSECMGKICDFHKLPFPTDDEKFPVGMGSNPVYLVDDHVIKIYVEGGLEACLHSLGTELEFYSLLCQVNSPLKNHVPGILASGIIFFENGSYTIVPWDGRGVPDVIANCKMIPKICMEVDFPFGAWSKKQFEYRNAGMSINESVSSTGCSRMWPYIVTKRCKGKIFAELRDTLSWEDMLNLASFLGDQLRTLHLLPVPSLDDSTFSVIKQKMELFGNDEVMEAVTEKPNAPAERKIFVRTLTRKKEDIINRITKWGNPIPNILMEKVNEYIPDDFEKWFNIYEDENGPPKVCKPFSWIHTDVMDDNIHMESCRVSSCSTGNTLDAGLMDNGFVNGHNRSESENSWHPSHILDFSDLSFGDPICDLIPIHLDVFRGDSRLLMQFLESYKLPLVRISQHESIKSCSKFGRLSYRAMCYCILHDDNVLGSILSLWKEVKKVSSWEEVEEIVWGDLNNYKVFC
ncbi:lysine-specific demethylase JMJ21 isoform X2 [Cornus florida]|uniref:lysine-specific demethylase JMJ21 isoform X2 n=1 Tax=Cornus florida TaxID=4283 RepID=UPI002898422C|nr:lysine-specific demethylase JMJ21 isoform X2 [Cornus florida]